MVDENKPGRRGRRRWKVAGAMVAIVLGGFALSNLLLPSRSAVTERLTEIDKTRLAEFTHLRRSGGDSLWMGWGSADIPVLLYNESYAFLTGYPDPPPGWRKVPDNRAYGRIWEPVPGDQFQGRPYYRQPLEQGGQTPEAFTVRVGDKWVVSMTLRDWMQIKLGNDMRDGLPVILRIIVPYRLIARFMSHSLGADWFISALAHESIHAFQGMVAEAGLTRAETIFSESGDRYPWENPEFNKAWKAEMKTLAEALRAKEDSSSLRLARDFLANRRSRRAAAGLDSVSVDLERHREWEEGLAKYTELAVWRWAGSTPDYKPVSGMDSDPHFRHYHQFNQRWNQELTTMRFQGAAGETRFYYSGMAQAFLLDRLAPGWRSGGMRDDLVLEDLLQAAVSR